MLTIDTRGALVCCSLGLALLAAPLIMKHDLNALISGPRCSILSEAQVGLVLESPVRLLPVNGEATCIYASTASVEEVLVTVHGDHRPPVIRIAGDGIDEETKRSQIGDLEGLVQQNLAQAH